MEEHKGTVSQQPENAQGQLYPTQIIFSEPQQNQSQFPQAQKQAIQVAPSTANYQQLDEQEPCFTYVKWYYGVIFLVLFAVFQRIQGILIQDFLDDLD